MVEIQGCDVREILLAERLRCLFGQSIESKDGPGIYQQSGSSNNQAIAKIAIHGALRLYLDFINLFLMFLQLTGSKKRH